MKNRTIILDLDDTLYCEHDYVKSGFLMVSKFLAAKSRIDQLIIYQKMVEIWNQYGRGKVFDLVCRFFLIENVEINQLVQLYREHVPNIQLYDDATAFLNIQREKGNQLGLITDGLSIMQWHKIKALKIEHYIDHIVVSDDLGGPDFWKPSSAPYLKVLNSLQIKAQTGMYVGDNPVKDFVTAKKLGMKTVRIVREIGDHVRTTVTAEFEADWKISSLLELTDG
ncbi:HAD family hydrolase [Amphibacillus sp. Q70]|uniref:HAD family hydrolase n=1 Tax=Amphibacillus sp. Q70 TaxID=3453416 RepID=UPI003F830C9D